MRTPSLTSAGSSATPFSVTECTSAVIASMNVDAPSVAANRTVVSTAEHLGAGGHVEHDVVVVHRDERRALLGFDAGEVLSGHVRSFAVIDAARGRRQRVPA